MVGGVGDIDRRVDIVKDHREPLMALGKLPMRKPQGFSLGEDPAFQFAVEPGEFPGEIDVLQAADGHRHHLVEKKEHRSKGLTPLFADQEDKDAVVEKTAGKL